MHHPYAMQPYAPMQPAFHCKTCNYWGNAMIVNKISTGGWVMFVVLLFLCFPLFWIGLLMREQKACCPNCRVMI